MLSINQLRDLRQLMIVESKTINGLEPDWITRVIVEHLGPVSYLIEIGKHHFWKRHVNHQKEMKDSRLKELLSSTEFEIIPNCEYHTPTESKVAIIPESLERETIAQEIVQLYQTKLVWMLHQMYLFRLIQFMLLFLFGSILLEINIHLIGPQETNYHEQITCCVLLLMSGVWYSSISIIIMIMRWSMLY